MFTLLENSESQKLLGKVKNTMYDALQYGNDAITLLQCRTKGESSMLFGFLLQKVSLNSFILKSNWAGQPF